MRSLCTAAFLLLATVGYAQSSRISVEAGGLLGGASSLSRHTASPFGPTKNHFITSKGVQLGVHYHFNARWSLKIGIQSSFEGNEWKFKYPNAYHNIIFDQRYIRVPLLVQYHFLKPCSKIRPYLGTGITFGYQYYSDDRHETSPDFGIAHIGYVHNAGNDLGLQLNAGCRWQVAPYIRLNIGAEAFGGVVNFTPSDFVKRLNTNNVSNLTIRGSAGIEFSF